MHATENPPDGEKLTDPLVAAITVASEGAECDHTDDDDVTCGAPAVVAISLDVWSGPLLRCAGCWPSLDEVFQRRGRTLTSH